MPKKGQNKYNWKEIQAYYDLGNSYKRCEEKFGVCNASLAKAVKRGDLKTRKNGETLKMAYSLGFLKPYSPTEEHRKILSKCAKERNFGGDNQSKKYDYNGFKLCSSYELRVAKLLDLVGIKWIKPKTTFKWIDKNSKSHTYHPDLYLNDLNIYLDPKNSYCIIRDAEKIQRVKQQNGVNVLIVPIEQIKNWEKDAKQIFKDLSPL